MPRLPDHYPARPGLIGSPARPGLIGSPARPGLIGSPARPGLIRFPAFALVAALAAAAGCIFTGGNTTITTDSDTDTDTSDSGSTTAGTYCPDPNSFWENGSCYCKAGYQFCSDNVDDLSCCPVGSTATGTPTTSAVTTDSTTDGTTTNPVTTGTTTGTTEMPVTSSTSGSTTGDQECMGAQPPPRDCVEGQFWCTQTEACGPQDSELYRCEQGTWMLDPNLAKDSCQFDGYDFAYGCVDDGETVNFICGDGPGTDCEETDPAACENDMTLAQCLLGKLTHFDCFVQCTEVGDDNMVLYDHGFCGDDMGTSVCLCCDMGDPGCPV